jgi:hypothetical protein
MSDEAASDLPPEELRGPFSTIPREALAHLLPEYVSPVLVRQVVTKLWEAVEATDRANAAAAKRPGGMRAPAVKVNAAAGRRRSATRALAITVSEVPGGSDKRGAEADACEELPQDDTAWMEWI